MWQIELLAELYDQSIENIFHYRGNALTSPDAIDIAEAFYDQILPDIQAITATDVFFTEIRVHDLMASDSPAIWTVGENGASSADQSLPPFNAFGFTLNVGSTVTRPGHKRFAGVVESDQNDGVVTAAGTIAAGAALATTLAFNLFDTATGLIPWAAGVIVKRILDDDSYRLPTSVGELVTNAIVDAAMSLIVSSQNSRKLQNS